MLTAKTSLALKSMTMKLMNGNLSLNGKWLKADIGNKKPIQKVGFNILLSKYLKVFLTKIEKRSKSNVKST